MKKEPLYRIRRTNSEWEFRRFALEKKHFGFLWRRVAFSSSRDFLEHLLIHKLVQYYNSDGSKYDGRV